MTPNHPDSLAFDEAPQNDHNPELADLLRAEYKIDIVTVEEFAAVEEPGAAAVVGAPGDVIIPQGGDVAIYGDGGAGKTTLMLDLACHLAAGDSWLGIPVTDPTRVLVLENEGPRPLFRDKLKRKLAGWTGSPLQGRLTIIENPWGSISFTDPTWQTALAKEIRDSEIDVVIAGPVNRLGMDEAGTLQQVRDFLRAVHEIRKKSGRPLAVILVHHENKGGSVSGAWEGAGDTLLHVENHSSGKTILHIQKARWSSIRHGTKLDLSWADNDGFTVEDDRDYRADIKALLADGNYRTVAEIAKPRKGNGIGARQDTVRKTLKDSPDVFIEHSGEEVGRSPKAVVYGLVPDAGIS